MDDANEESIIEVLCGLRIEGQCEGFLKVIKNEGLVKESGLFIIPISSVSTRLCSNISLIILFLL